MNFLEHFRVLAAGLVLVSSHAPAQTFFVAMDGNDSTGDGSPGNEWATISHAVGTVPDGATVIVRPGEYAGAVALDRAFAAGIVVASEQPYRARLRHSGAPVVRCFTGRNITLEGFDIAHAVGNTAPLVIQIQDLLGASAGPGSDGNDPQVSGIVLRNNVLHDSTNNDILKVNNGARDIVIEGNVFYNQQGSDEHIDVNSVTGVLIQDNIFFNDFAASGRINGNETSSFIVVKDSNGNSDDIEGSKEITIRRNIFLNWEGSPGHGFLGFGEDGTFAFETDGALVENNLFLGNASNLMRSALRIAGCANITIRHNTVVGDMPARSYAGRLIRLGSNQPNSNIIYANNLFSDPTGTMGTEAFNGVDVFEAPAADNASVTLLNNLYHNGGAPIPPDTGQGVRAANDTAAIIADPLLPALSGIVPPVWQNDIGEFADGSTTIREAFVSLAETYGRPAAGSPALGSADPGEAATEDLLGNPRTGLADVGALQDAGSSAVEGFLLFVY